MTNHNSIIKSMWYIILLIIGFIDPILGIIPIFYLKYKSEKDTDLYVIKNWIKFGEILQLLYIVLLILIMILFTPMHSVHS